MKLDVLFWFIIGLTQLAVWNLHFRGWDHGWANHNAFWARRLPTGVPPEALNCLGGLALVVAFLLKTRVRLLILLGMVLGLPFLWWVTYHCWVPYLFDCCSLWHHGGNYRNFDFTSMQWKPDVDYPAPSRMMKAWAKEYRDSIRIMPLLHESPFFVDLTNIMLTILVVLAYYYSFKALIWPRDDDDDFETEPVKAEKKTKKVKSSTSSTSSSTAASASPSPTPTSKRNKKQSKKDD